MCWWYSLTRALRPSVPLPGQSLGTQHSETRSFYAAWTPQSIINRFALCYCDASFLRRMFQNSRSRSPLLWEFPVTSSVSQRGGRSSSTNVSMRFCIDCWKTSQLCSGSSFLKEFGDPRPNYLIYHSRAQEASHLSHSGTPLIHTPEAQKWK